MLSGRLLCTVKGIIQNRVHNLLARVIFSRQNESRVKNNVPYLEGQFVGGGQLEMLIANLRCFCITYNQFFFNICGWAFIRVSILGKYA